MTHQDSSKPSPITHEEADPTLDEIPPQDRAQATAQRSDQHVDHLGEVVTSSATPQSTTATSQTSPLGDASRSDHQTLARDETIGDVIDEAIDEVLEKNTGVLGLGEQWRCVVCDHLETHNKVRCSSCHYWRAEFSTSSGEPLNTNAVHGAQAQSSPSDKAGDEEVLETAFTRLQKLFVRAQQEGRSLGDAERARLYEALLLSLFKIERASIKKVMLKDFFHQEREERRRAHMIHLSIIWFLGICTGFALYFGLQSVSG